MADELDEKLNENDPVEGRIKDLSKKVKIASEERDEKARLFQEQEAKTTEATIERDFYKGFSASTAKYPAATEFQDEILGKVKAGYSVEDATISVLNGKGKLMPQAVERQPVAGGSAATNIVSGGNKSAHEMSREEKRAALIEAEQRGDIGIS